MSNYTDDTQDTLVISDSTQSEFSQLFTDVLKASEALLFGLAVSISSSAVIADEVTGSASTITSETLMISDTLSDSIHATNYSADWIVVTDKTTNKITTIFPIRLLRKIRWINLSLRWLPIFSRSATRSLRSEPRKT